MCIARLPFRNEATAIATGARGGQSERTRFRSESIGSTEIFRPRAVGGVRELLGVRSHGKFPGTFPRPGICRGYDGFFSDVRVFQPGGGHKTTLVTGALCPPSVRPIREKT